MEERETQAREDVGGRASAPARWLPFAAASAAVVAVGVMAAPAGGGAVATSQVSADAAVEARDNSFMPPTVTINQGETVTWTNVGNNPHNVHFQDGFDEPPAPDSSNWSVMRKFDVPGAYSYVCEQHPSMTGTVNVNAVAPPPGGPPPPGGGTPPPGGGNPPPGGGGSPPGSPAPGTPGAGKSATTVTLQVSDATPTPGARVRFFGTVRPEQDGRLVQLQRRVRGSFRTVLRIKLTDAGSARSKFSKRLRVLGDAVFRARVPADSAHEAGTSRARRLDVR